MSTNGDGGKDDDSTSFAELIGETKPISRGPARVEKSTRGLQHPRPRIATEQTAGFRWPDQDEPRLAAAPGVNDVQLLALGRGEPEPEETIDLHGLRLDAARRILKDRIESARARNLRCVVLVHGRGQRSGTGEAVLRDAIPEWLSNAACAQHLLGFAPAPNRLGGEGAMLVLLRKPN